MNFTLLTPSKTFPKRTAIAALASFAAFAAPAAASAADRWVDTQTGSDAANDCTLLANPCKTINRATQQSQSNGDSGTIHVDQGTYAEQVGNLAQTNHLLADDFVSGDSGATTIDGGSGIALFVQASASASGFDITSTTAGSVVLATDNSSVSDNTIAARGANSTAVEIFPSSGATMVEDNTFLADSGDEDNGVVVDQNATGGAVVSGNDIGESRDGFARGVVVRAGSRATVSGNTILGTRQDGGLAGNGVLVDGADDVELVANEIAEPALSGSESDGVYVTSTAATDSVSLERNRIVGMTDTGLVLADTAGSVDSTGDLIAANSDRAVFAGNAPAVTFTNDTIVGNTNTPVVLNTAAATIDSSILDVPITSSGGAVSCEITYSRGPAIVEGGNGCGEFQTTADPQFVAVNTLDYHLKTGSPLVDQGNPATPATGAVDIDGDARALEGDGACPRADRRDIGADEVVAGPFADCPVAETPDTTAPDSGIEGKRKQHGRKARFTLTSTEQGSTFECRLDRGKFVPCGARYKSRKLNLGRHTLFTRATDEAGNTDATPAAMKFKLKR